MTTTPAMPERFTKKPVTVEAFQMTEARRMDNRDWPEWLHQAWNKEEGQPGALFRQNMDAPLPDLLCIQTLEGVHLVNWGDWIIRGVKGELYPCKPDIFEMTYDRATLQAQPAAEVSDADIESCALESGFCVESTGAIWAVDGCVGTRVDPGLRKFARAILALRPQAVPMTPDVLELRAAAKSVSLMSVLVDGRECAVPFDQIKRLDAAIKAIDHGITAPAGGEG